MRIIDERRSGSFQWFDVDDEDPPRRVNRHDHDYVDTLSALVEEGFFLIELRSPITGVDIDGVIDAFEVDLPEAAHRHQATKVALLWATSDELEGTEGSRILGWVVTALLGVEYDPTSPLEVALVLASQQAPSELARSVGFLPWA